MTWLYRLRGADGVIVVARGEDEGKRVVREMVAKFGPKGWCVVGPAVEEGDEKVRSNGGVRSGEWERQVESVRVTE